MSDTSKTLTNTPDLWLDEWPTLNYHSHKYTRGHTMVVGGETITGAARLSALAAARIGSGLTSLLVPQSAFSIYAASMLSVMVKPYADQVTFSHHILDKKIKCFVIGPGAGVNPNTRWQVLQLLQAGKALVLDADALTVFAGNLSALTNAIQSPCVLTPHEGEFKRLFELTEDRIKSTQKAAKLANAIVVLKGAETIIAAPDGNVIVNRDAPPTLATGGSGDVLAGLIAGLLAQGMHAFKAAAAANWVHSQAAKLFGPGLIAEDLPGSVPQVLKQLQK